MIEIFSAVVVGSMTKVVASKQIYSSVSVFAHVIKCRMVFVFMFNKTMV